MKTFTISIEGECTLSKDDIWPDGHAPTRPTAQDVIDVILAAETTVHGLIRSWNLPCSVSVDGEHAMEEI